MAELVLRVVLRVVVEYIDTCCHGCSCEGTGTFELKLFTLCGGVAPATFRRLLHHYYYY